MTEPVTIGALWRGWRDALARQGFATPALDAKLLAGHAMGLDALALSLRENEPVPGDQVAAVERLLQRRLRGESVARIIGDKAFYGLDFGLNAATLEPRPDTELLVDLVLSGLKPAASMLDLGTGTGCIPIAILVNRPDVTGLATDLSPLALEMAEDNARRHQVSDRLRLARGDWFAALADQTARFDLITSNPPYIASEIVESLAPEVREFDPRLALDGGPDGLGPYRIIAAEAGRWLTPGGRLVVEIGYDQGQAVAKLFSAAGLVEIAVHKDLAGLDRVVCAHHIGAA
ncbi:MAG: peptide chain release factor N(5)-glutamine methyltransferase [Devosia sp.]|nr:peptide chain release factor N(5)-glutamine methyltransferase [Devosia sp.]